MWGVSFGRPRVPPTVRRPKLASLALSTAPRRRHSQRRMRTKGSVRFSAYFKVQWRDPRSAAWVDVQQAHPTSEAARAAFLAGRDCRVIEVTERGRRPVQDV